MPPDGVTKKDGNVPDDLLDVLRANHGFGPQAEQWLPYARAHGFRRVRATARHRCPDCSSAKAGDIGQFVFYSSLIRLRACEQCGLHYTDCELDNTIVTRHFSTAYKDEAYFARHRRSVFEQITSLVERLAPEGGAVLDVGGAKGHLMAMLRQRRPDLRITVSDLSDEACAWAARTYGFSTLRGRIAELANVRQRFDVVVLSDVIYYEPSPRPLWNVLPALLADGGTLIIRAPNTARVIAVAESLRRLFGSRGAGSRVDRIRFFNPEHNLLFPRRFLEERLRGIGFQDVRTLPGRAGGVGVQGILEGPAHAVATALNSLTGGRLVLAPSFVMIARRPRGSAPRQD